MNLNKPLRLNEEFEIVDAMGSIVIPCIVWSGDIPHKNQQRELGECICEIINVCDREISRENMPSIVRAMVLGIKQADKDFESTKRILGKSIPEIIEDMTPKKRGNPAFQKGAPNPYK